MNGSTVSTASVLHFGVFELDLRSGDLRRSGLLVHLSPQPFQVLVLLASHPMKLVTRDDIRREIWGDQTFVDFEQGLNHCIRQVRKALGDDASSPRYIETLPRRGYRFIYPVSAGRLADGRGFAAKAKRKLLAGGWMAAVGLAVVIAAGFFTLEVSGLHNPARAAPSSLLENLPPVRSLAVLPFENLSGDPDQDFFAEDVTENVIAALEKIKPLRVLSRQSVMRYQGSRETVPEIAGELSVDAILEGSVLRSGDRLRVAANLLQGSTGRKLWTNSYEGPSGQGTSLQGRIARAIAGGIRAEVAPQPGAGLALDRSADLEAQRFYVMGRIYRNRWNRSGDWKALDYFQRAVEIDPGYPAAYVGVADVYNDFGRWGILAPSQAYPEGEAAARRALELDSRSAQAHAALALDYWEYYWDWAAGEEEFQRAIELDPEDAAARRRYSEYLAAMGRAEEGMMEARRAQLLDPLEPLTAYNLVCQCYFLRRYDEAIRRGKLAISWFPGFLPSYDILARACLAKGMDREAISAYEKKMSLSGAGAAETAALGGAFAKGGLAGYYRWQLRRLQKEAKGRYVAAMDFAYLYIALGEKDRAFSYLEKAYQAREWRLSLLRVDPALDSLRSDPRFENLLRRMNLPPLARVHQP